MPNPSITPLNLKDLLSDTATYLVPMYQRNYAWGEAEITQLVQDILDYCLLSQKEGKNKTYYIGTLVVFPRSGNIQEVIDGQQRFTTLTLLALWLKNHGGYDLSWYNKVNLIFESRPISKETFDKLWLNVSVDKLKNSAYNTDLVKGYDLLGKALTERVLNTPYQNAFYQYFFTHVQITRISVPPDTDLNHYFEAMNNRGEQLEKHEVLKARLMARLSTAAEWDIFNILWTACSNMEHYIQLAFTTTERHQLFGKNDWRSFIPKTFADIAHCLAPTATANQPNTTTPENTTQSLLAILEGQQKAQPTSDPQKKQGKEEGQDAFPPLINFPNFLLQVLQIYTKQNISLDDKQLIKEFEHHILNKNNAEQLIKEFSYTLLKCKYLLDQFVIKRDASHEQEAWSLKSLKYGTKNTFYYVNSFSDPAAQTDTLNSQICLLLSAFHVSVPSMSYKYWLNGALTFLYTHTQEQAPCAQAYLHALETLAKRFVFEIYLAPDDYKQEYFELLHGETLFASKYIDEPTLRTKLRFKNTRNNFVFNYLDYLIWLKNNKDQRYSNFIFTSRSSVEHFYPQNPKDGYIKFPENSLNSFGNLCLISHSKNSTLNNYQPTQKKEHFEKSLQKNQIDSLKLLCMIDLMNTKNTWGEEEIHHHENEMVELFMSAATNT